MRDNRHADQKDHIEKYLTESLQDMQYQGFGVEITLGPDFSGYTVKITKALQVGFDEIEDPYLLKQALDIALETFEREYDI